MDEIKKRVEKVEDAQSFTDHKTDQLNEQIVHLAAEVDKLSKRVIALEKRLAEFEESETEAETVGDVDQA